MSPREFELAPLSRPQSGSMPHEARSSIRLIVTDGFSCRQQIAHGTGQRALHLAEVLQLALEGDR
jgi:hypothetical protein